MRNSATCGTDQIFHEGLDGRSVDVRAARSYLDIFLQDEVDRVLQSLVEELFGVLERDRVAYRRVAGVTAPRELHERVRRSHDRTTSFRRLERALQGVAEARGVVRRVGGVVDDFQPPRSRAPLLRSIDLKISATAVNGRDVVDATAEVAG